MSSRDDGGVVSWICCWREVERAWIFIAGYLETVMILLESLLSYESRRERAVGLELRRYCC